MRSVTLPHVGYDYMSSRLAHDQTFTGCSVSIMGCTQDSQRLQDVPQRQAHPILFILSILSEALRRAFGLQ